MSAPENSSDSQSAGELCALVQHIAAQLVDNPDGVQVTSDQRGNAIRIALEVDDDDMGKVIGREGRIARSMRTMLMIAASRRGMRSNLDIGR